MGHASTHYLDVAPAAVVEYICAATAVSYASSAPTVCVLHHRLCRASSCRGVHFSSPCSVIRTNSRGGVC